MDNNVIVDPKKFEVLQNLDSGVFGSVSKVKDRETGIIYAAKVITTHGKKAKRKRIVNRKIRIMMRCQHPTIIKFHGYSLTDFNGEENVTLIMELAANVSLRKLLENIKKGLSEDVIDNTIRQKILVGIARGMMYLHQQKITHRDLKPENILLDEDL